MRIRGFEAGIVALHIHLPATSQTDFPEIQEPDLADRFTGCADEIARHSTGEVPVQKVKTEAQIVHRRANEVLSQRQFCRAYSSLMACRSPMRRPRSGSAGALCTNGCDGFWRRASRAWRTNQAVGACRPRLPLLWSRTGRM